MKRKSAFTPGPWTTIDGSNTGRFVYYPKGDRIVAETYADHGQDFDANAQLISACPDLYAAAVKLCEGKTDGKFRDKAWRDLRAAIAKARGEK